MRKTEEEQSAKLIRFMSSILLGGVLALAVCLVFLFLCSIGISSGWVGDRFMVQYTLAGCVLGSLSGGMFAVLRCRSRTLVVGLGVGAVLFLLLLTVGLLFYPGMSVENRGVGLLCGCLFGGALAGLWGGKPKKKRRK
ncbi:MAG: TIGR04086 family membrane protein [Oscillospiraceae bacterium]